MGKVRDFEEFGLQMIAGISDEGKNWGLKVDI
jgi:hypothetical protein